MRMSPAARMWPSSAMRSAGVMRLGWRVLLTALLQGRAPAIFPRGPGAEIQYGARNDLATPADRLYPLSASRHDNRRALANGFLCA